MATLQEIYQQYLDMDDSKRMNIAKNCAGEFITYAEGQGLSQDDIVALIVNLFKLFVSGDKHTANAEHEFFNATTGLSVSYDDFFKMTDYGANESFVASMDRLIDSMPQDVKNSTLIFGLCVMACDGRLTVSEQQLLNRLLA